MGTVAGEERYDSRNHYPVGKIGCPAEGQAAWILLPSTCGPPDRIGRPFLPLDFAPGAPTVKEAE